MWRCVMVVNASNLFIIQSPLQLVSAIEAANHFSSNRNILIVRYTSEQSTNVQINAILKLYNQWDDVQVIAPNVSVVVTGFRLIKLIFGLNNRGYKPARLFMGDYRSWYVPYLIKKCLAEDYYLLDDGNATIDLQKNYLPRGRYYFGEGLRGYIKKWLLFLLGPQSNKIMNLFTCFNLEPYCTQQSIIRHNFEYFRARSLSKLVDSSSVYFFGGPFSELGFMTLEQELNFLNKVNNKYLDKNINLIYVPHRRDSANKMKLINSSLRIRVYEIKYCAEIDFILSHVVPVGIASFYSTVLYTLPKIVNFGFVDSYKFPISKMPKFHREAMEDVYREYSKLMNVIDLEADEKQNKNLFSDY